MAVPRHPEPWPTGGFWWPEDDHEPFNPPNYNDWRNANPLDFRDLDYNIEHVDQFTGLPPRDHQGMEYRPGFWRILNSHGGLAPQGPRFNPPNLTGKKRRLTLVWPSDGKRGSEWGRWKDIASGKGPDIFVCRQGNRPSRNQWRNNWMDWTPEDPGFNSHIDMPWARRNSPYDFRERKYRKKLGPGDIVWSDATWPDRGADHYQQPMNYRCNHGRWHNMFWAPFGGVPLEGYNGIRLRNRGIFA